MVPCPRPRPGRQAGARHRRRQRHRPRGRRAGRRAGCGPAPHRPAGRAARRGRRRHPRPRRAGRHRRGGRRLRPRAGTTPGPRRHRAARPDGRGPQRRRHRDLGHRPQPGAPALAAPGRRQPDGPHPRDRGVRAADDRRRPRRAAGQRLLGGRDHRDALARGLQRLEVRRARCLGGAALRPATAPDRGQPGLPRRGRHRAGRDDPDRRHRPAEPRLRAGPEALPAARGLTRAGGGRDLARRAAQPLLGLHLRRHQRCFPPGYALAMRAFSYGANRVLPAVEQARRPELP